MKEEILSKLDEFRADLLKLRKEVTAISGERVAKIEPRNMADGIATKWVEELRSPLEHKLKLNQETISQTAEQMKRLHVLSRPNNLKTSYLEVVNSVLNKFDDKFILPIKQTALNIETVFDLEKIIPNLSNPVESEYLKEAINCANDGYKRASIVMGWCAAIDRIQRKIMAIGFSQFNEASRRLKAQTSGKYSKWNKEFSITTLSELQTVFDTDLIVILESLELIDGNEAERLRTCFQYRNHSAHPGNAPIDDPHIIAFFTDINTIILQNAKFNV